MRTINASLEGFYTKNYGLLVGPRLDRSTGRQVEAHWKKMSEVLRCLKKYIEMSQLNQFFIVGARNLSTVRARSVPIFWFKF
jgi:hypothetical protein